MQPVVLKSVVMAQRAGACLAANPGAFALAVLTFAGRGLSAVRQFMLSRLRAVGAAIEPLARLVVGEFHAVLARTIAYGFTLAAMGLMVVECVTLPRGVIVAQATGLEWNEIVRPFPAFAMTMPDFDGAPRAASWRHANGGGRKDVLTFSGAGNARAVIEFYRPGAEPNPDELDITASISQLRLSSVAPALPDTIETKFGPVTVESFVDRSPTGERGCLRFSRAFEEPAFEFSGWFCNAGPAMVERGMIACALDRLSLLTAGNEPRLAALFARAELNRTFCGTNSVFVAATAKRQDWIEAARDPRLRGRN